MERILIIGASGQIGTDLVIDLRKKYGSDMVFAADIKDAAHEVMDGGPFLKLNAMDKEGIRKIVSQNHVTQVYLLAALLSATGEQNPQLAWDLNMTSLSHVLDLCREGLIKKVFFPSSIAAFGPTTPKVMTPQRTVMEPSTVYGITKLAGERWAEYYFKRYNTDIRSLRYPGLISWKAAPGGGTTDYAVQIFHDALKSGHHKCFLEKGTTLPMMYMPDAIKATLDLMDASPSKLTVRSSYNIAGVSFSPEEIFEAIKKHIPAFTISYEPDFRQQIAESWPQSIDDSQATADWGWKPSYDLDGMVKNMLENLERQFTRLK
jgi:nucleoside-diphosphate-sugar epimerase